MECKGIRYRADISTRQTKRGIQRMIHLRLLKTQSCPGCPECQQVLAWAAQGANIHRFGEVEHGMVYRLHKEEKPQFVILFSNRYFPDAKPDPLNPGCWIMG